MVVHPDQFQVENVLREILYDRFGLDPADYDLGLPQQFLRAYCEQRGIPCVDLLPTFRANGQQGGLYETYDTHYNDRGNRLAATTIFDFLEEAVLARGRVAARNRDVHLIE